MWISFICIFIPWSMSHDEYIPLILLKLPPVTLPQVFAEQPLFQNFINQLLKWPRSLFCSNCVMPNGLPVVCIYPHKSSYKMKLNNSKSQLQIFYLLNQFVDLPCEAYYVCTTGNILKISAVATTSVRVVIVSKCANYGRLYYIRFFGSQPWLIKSV